MEHLVARLRLAPDLARRAARDFAHATHHYSLEGDQMCWMVCAIYTASNNAKNNSNESPGGNSESVSLTKLLQICNITPTIFLNKIKRWIEMTKISDDFKAKISLLERKFSVSNLLFEQFKSIFSKLFVTADSEDSAKSKNAKTQLCTPSNFFEFAWCLFICVKGERPHNSNDYVHNYHILLSCMDMVYANAYMALRKDLINPSFEGLPSDWSSMKSKPTTVPCIMELLSRNNADQVIPIKSIKQYAYRESIVIFFYKGVLKGDKETLTGLIDSANYDLNFKALNKIYSTYMLNAGEYDERLFLDNNSNDTSEEVVVKPTSSQKVSDTPLTGRHYLKNKSEHLTPGSVTTQNAAKIQIYLTGCSNTPSKFLLGIYPDASIFENIIKVQKALSVKLLTPYASKCSEDLANNRVNYIEAFFYRLLEDVIKEEHRKKGQINLQALLINECFHQTLYACCAEIILYINGSHNFPWILDVLEIQAFYFYKIIEIVVLVIKEKLTRDIIKHLSAIEEQVLQSLAWTSNSPLWDKIPDLGDTIPPWSDVCIPGREDSNTPTITNHYEPELQTVRVLQTIARMPQSPSSASERFLSPISDAKQIFFNEIRPGQSLLHQNIVSSNEKKIDESPTKVRTETTTPKKPIKGGSIGFFFRKFYSLAGVRMDDLCARLKINLDLELVQKIWTCFEYSIINFTHLIKDRHLDQLLMCAVYVVCKVTKSEQNKVVFTDIMRCYRQQPQAQSHVYRKVLVPSLSDENNGNNQTEGNARADREVDLIEFYNRLYVPCMQQFVARFNKTSPTEQYELSPVPTPRNNNLNKNNLNGARRVSENHHLFIRPLTDNTAITNEQSQLTYCFSRSPAKDLQRINSLMSKEEYCGKRRIQITDGDHPVNKKLSLDGTDENNAESNGISA